MYYVLPDPFSIFWDSGNTTFELLMCETNHFSIKQQLPYNLLVSWSAVNSSFSRESCTH